MIIYTNTKPLKPIDLIDDQLSHVTLNKLKPLTMERNATLAGAVLVLHTTATAQPSIPPDRYGEECKGSIGFFENLGQLIDENSEPRPDILFSSVGSVPKAALGIESKVSFLTYEHGATPTDPVQVNQITMQPWGSKARKVDPEGIAVKDWYQNFYLPQTAPDGASQVTGFERVVYEEIYKEIDMHFYSGSGGQKMAFVMWPGSHPEDLRLLFAGQDSLKVDLFGNLKMFHDGNFFVLPEAVAYQVEPNNTVVPIGWNAGYQLVGTGGVVEFGFDSYDPDLPLIFQVGAMPAGGPDPLEHLCWSTYLGGTNGDQINASAMDADGNFFVTGYSLSDFYSIPNIQGTALINGGQVCFLARFDANYHLLWLTYYGASATDQQSNAVAVRGSGADEKVYMGGYTTGANLFGVVETGAYNLQTVTLGYYRRAIISKFDMNGFISWGTYFGDGHSELFGMDVDTLGRLHIVGEHYEQNVPLLPLAGATNETFTGLRDLIVARFTSADTLNWCSVYGEGTGKGIRCTPDGGFVVSGRQGAGINFPDQGNGALYLSNAGGGDCTLLKFNAAAHLDHGTYYGGDDFDDPAMNSLELTSDGGIYLVGNTNSTSGFPLVAGGGDLDSVNTGNDGFIAYLKSDLSLAWSTFVNAKLNGVSIDDKDNAFPVGTTLYAEPDSAPLVFAGNYYNQPDLEGNNDGVVLGFNEYHHQFYGTYFGGPEGSYPDEVTTTQWHGERLYIAGFTTKQQDVTSFFPLHDPGQPAYYDGTYQYVPGQLGLNQNYQDAFAAAICGSNMIGIDELPDARNKITISPLVNGQRTIRGLPEGGYELTLYDALGKHLGTQWISSNGGEARMQQASFAAGLYIVRIQGKTFRGTIRFIAEQ